MSESSGARRVLLATANPHKVVEIQAVLGGAWHVVPFAPAVAETGSSFEENALQKAVALRDVTGELTVADDSGIEIDALGGRPGVYSARWTNEEDWIPRVLRELHGFPMPVRTCRYVCAAAVAYPDGTENVVRAEVKGHIAEHPRGEEGFGYDAIMIPEEGGGQTFAEMEGASKNGISHRGRAFQLLEQLLRVEAAQAVVETDPEAAALPVVEGYDPIPDAYRDLVQGEFAAPADYAGYAPADDGARADEGDEVVPAVVAAGSWADQSGGGGPVDGGGGYPDGPDGPAPVSWPPGGDQPGGGPAGGAGGAGGPGGAEGDQAGGPGGAPQEPDPGQPLSSD